jgi:uncharacterized protein (TIGR02453 family)
MAGKPQIFKAETFRFFRELKRNNSKVWMDANRDRYQEHVVAPFRALLNTLAGPALKLNPDFDISGRTGANFSRINRDIRFSKDKTPYRPQMYLIFPNRASGGWAGGQLYVGITVDSVTWGFRVYDDWKGKTSALAQVTAPGFKKKPDWVKRQAKRLKPRYESYWYSIEKKKLTKHDGWPIAAEDWNNLRGWIVRRKLRPEAALRASFLSDVEKSFREVFPLYGFTSLKNRRG